MKASGFNMLKPLVRLYESQEAIVVVIVFAAQVNLTANNCIPYHAAISPRLGNYLKRSFRSYVCAASLLLGTLATANANAATIVLPGSAEGATSVQGCLNATAYTVQWVYSSSLLASVPAGAQITGMQYRRNGGGTTAPSTTATFADYEIYISSSNFAPGSLTTNFANNEGTDRVQVRDGALSIPVNSYPGGSTPNDWGPVLSFSTPYTYTGNDLLITVRQSGNTGGGLAFVDAVNGTSTVDFVSSSGSQTATTGARSSGIGVVAQFTYTIVPETNTATLAAFVLPLVGMVAAIRRRK